MGGPELGPLPDVLGLPVLIWEGDSVGALIQYGISAREISEGPGLPGRSPMWLLNQGAPALVVLLVEDEGHKPEMRLLILVASSTQTKCLLRVSLVDVLHCAPRSARWSHPYQIR